MRETDFGYAAAPWRTRCRTCSSCRPILRPRIKSLDGSTRPYGSKRDVYSGRLRQRGEEGYETLAAANNYASSLISLKRFEEASHCCAKQCPWRAEFLERVMNSRSKMMVELRASALTRTRLPRSTISARPWRRSRTRDGRARRVLGGAHPTRWGLRALCETREPRYHARGGVESLTSVR